MKPQWYRPDKAHYFHHIKTIGVWHVWHNTNPGQESSNSATAILIHDNCRSIPDDWHHVFAYLPNVRDWPGGFDTRFYTVKPYHGRKKAMELARAIHNLYT